MLTKIKNIGRLISWDTNKNKISINSSSDLEILIQDGVILDIGQSLINFADTASVISKLDLIISVDTAVAHLAATIGLPTWIMLSANPDWRWLLDRNDSPWYSTVRLFRQDTVGNWDCVISKISYELKKYKRKK